MVFDAVFFLKCWCKSILCDSNVVATFTWLQLFPLISDVFFYHIFRHTPHVEKIYKCELRLTVQLFLLYKFLLAFESVNEISCIM